MTEYIPNWYAIYFFNVLKCFHLNVMKKLTVCVHSNLQVSVVILKGFEFFPEFAKVSTYRFPSIYIYIYTNVTGKNKQKKPPMSEVYSE